LESGAIGSKGKEGEGQRLKRREATKKKRKERGETEAAAGL